MKNKGIAYSVVNAIMAFLIIGMTIFLIFFHIGGYFSIKETVQQNENERKAIALGELLSTTDLLVYSDGYTVHKGVLAVEKLTNLQDKQSKIFDAINFTDINYYFKITDLETDESWSFGSPQVSRTTQLLRIVYTPYKKDFPVSIKYTDGKMNIGMLSVTVEVLTAI